MAINAESTTDSFLTPTIQSPEGNVSQVPCETAGIFSLLLFLQKKILKNL